MNTIAAGAVLLPAIIGLARTADIRPSKLLIPLSYGTLLGGMATLLTTSSILVNAALRDVKGIFFTGGDQNRITRAFLGTPAGAACVSGIMITGDGEPTAVRGRAVGTEPGPGFVPEAVIDQHFIAQQRLGRLLSVVLEHPALLGIGIDARLHVLLPGDRDRCSACAGRLERAARAALCGGDGRRSQHRTGGVGAVRTGGRGLSQQVGGRGRAS